MKEELKERIIKMRVIGGGIIKVLDKEFL